MIFTANKIDASSNFIDKINLKSIDEVSQETYDLIASYGGKQLSDARIIALDNFLEAFNKSTYKPKIKSLIVPLIGVNNETPDNRVPYPSLYDIVTKKQAQLVAGAGHNEYGHGKIFTFHDGLYTNSFSDDFHYTPHVAITRISIDISNISFGIWGKRGDDVANTGFGFGLYQDYIARVGKDRIQFSSGAQATKFIYSTIDKGQPVNVIASYNLNEKISIGILNEQVKKATDLKGAYIKENSVEGYTPDSGEKLADRLGNTIYAMMFGEALTETELKDFNREMSFLINSFVV